MKKLSGINLAIIILSGILMLILGYGFIQVNSEKIAKNTYIKDIDVGSLNKEEATKKIKYDFKIDTITFTYKDKEWNVEPEEIDAKYDIDKTVEDALSVNRNGNIISNIIDMIKSSVGIQTDINVDVECDEVKLKNKLEQISKEINVDMENASLEINSDKVVIKKEKAGIQLDLQSTMKNLKKSLQDGIYKENLVVTKIEPEVIEDDLKNINTVLGSFKTILTDTREGRVENIKLATQRTSGVLLMPGEEFSYNKHTGMRTEENGYKNATVIVSGQAVEGVGGGVCQVSTTLYNAVLYAGLDIVKVTNHSIPSSYAPKGRDATVNDSGTDFVFKNNYNQPVYVRNYYSNGYVVCQIYGSLDDKKDIEIVTNTDKMTEPEVKRENDPTLEEGKEKILEYGRSSYVVSTYRVYYDKEGKQIKREKIATSNYPSKQQIIAVGTMKKESTSLNENNNSNNQQNNNDKNENAQNSYIEESSMDTNTDNDTNNEDNNLSEDAFSEND